VSSVPTVIDRGTVARQEFGGSQIQTQAETAIAAVSARERAKVEAMYLMAERHPRNWDTVRVRLLGHCDRPGFAEIARYKKPAGRKKVNGQWQETYAEGLSARFAEIARQEAGNLSTESAVIYEDDLIRIVRASVIDLERNNNDSREITIAKAVEKKGKQVGKDWQPPEGREIIGNPRLNSYGEPVWLVKATDDEIRSRQNSEISKAQRDESLRLIPKDIRDDCEALVIAVLLDPKKVDPTAARKKVIDGFARIGVLPDDLVVYVGCALDRMSPAQVDELRGLWTAINDGETDFQRALKVKYASQDAEGQAAAGSAAEAQRVGEEKIAAMQADAAKRAASATPPAEPAKEPAPPYIQDEGKPYTAETLPHPSSVKVDTECLYQDGDRLKHLRVVEEPGEAPKWVTVEEVNAHAQAAREEKPGLEPAASTAARPKFGRRG